VSDIGEAVANILSSPTSHVGQTYVLSGRAYCNAEVAAALSKSLGRDIEYVQIPYDAAFESFVGAGWPAWQVKGLLEIFRACDAGEFVYDDSVLARVLGRPPLTIEEWVESVKAGFTA
jgi:NAD(P)H dehydrogenase (quinone)